MKKTQRTEALDILDLEIKKQQAEILKAQARRENAEADYVVAKVAMLKGADRMV